MPSLFKSSVSILYIPGFDTCLIICFSTSVTVLRVKVEVLIPSLVSLITRRNHFRSKFPLGKYPNWKKIQKARTGGKKNSEGEREEETRRREKKCKGRYWEEEVRKEEEEGRRR